MKIGQVNFFFKKKTRKVKAILEIDFGCVRFNLVYLKLEHFVKPAL